MFSSYILLTSLLTIVMCRVLLKRHIDFRERFLDRQMQRQLKDQRINVLDNFILKDTEIIDDIPHYRKIRVSSPKWKKIKAIEKDFRRLLAMNGMKYNYKRDMYWRTWRSITSIYSTQIVSYKCNNLQVNATGCQSCGMWTIEERPPPCPFEFFSVITDQKFCGANYTQYKDVDNACPSVIQLSDLTATCDNPIETEWRFSKMYGAPETENSENIICAGNDFCDILTIYEISREHVIFRIINSTDDVMYSRVMKPNNTNYMCVDDCGRFNPNTRKVAKADKPLKLDLLNSPRKSKREDLLNGMNDTMPTEAILPPKTITMSEIGGNHLDISDDSKLMKMQSNFNVKNKLLEEFKKILSVTQKPFESHYQEVEKEADRVSYEDGEEPVYS